MSCIRSINASSRSWRRSVILCFAGLFVLSAHVFAQSVITTYVGPQLPVSGKPALNQAVDFPSAVIPDGAGGIYVVSTNQNRVYDITADGTLRLVAGSSYGFGGDGGRATDAKLASPSGLARDSVGTLYIADTYNSRIRKVTTDGVITTIAGTDTAGFSGDGGPATSAQLWGPAGVAVDINGNIYIADAANNRVRKVTRDGVIRTVAGGAPLSPGSSPVNGLQATSAAISRPSAVAVDVAGNLYIASSVVLRVGPDGTLSVLTTIHGTYAGGPFGFFCSPDGDGGLSSAASVCSPNGLSIDAAGNLYVSENDRIREIAVDGLIHTVAGGDQCTMNSADGSPATSVCLRPFDVAVGGDGSLYVPEAFSNLVRKVTPDGVLTTILANTIGGFAGDGGPATSAKLSHPVAVALDAGGNLYIADIQNARVREVTPNGVISTIAGSGVYGVAGDGGPATASEMRSVRDIFIDSPGNIYILDDIRVRKISTDGVINTIAGCFDCNVGTATNQDGVPATDSVLWTYPFRIAVDAAGTLYIAESDRVRKVGADGIITTIFGNGNPALGGDGGHPSLNQHLVFSGFELDPAGGFYISANDGRIRKVTPDGLISTIAGSGTCRIGADNSDGGPATSADLCPGSIKLDAAGNLYVAERGSANRIRKISTEGIINTIAGGNSVWGFSGDGGPATSAQLNDLSDVAVDATGNLYIADLFNNRIRKVSASSTCGTTPEPSMTINLQPGFYIAEVRNRAGTPGGFWGMEVRPQLGSLPGGFDLGGGTFTSNGLTSFGAFDFPSGGTVHIKVDTQVLTGTGPFSMTLRLLDANHQPIMPDQEASGTSAEFDTPPLAPGFYIVEVRTTENAPTATYQMQLGAPGIGVVADAGGYVNDGIVGFGAFYISQSQDVAIKVFGTSAYGPAAAACPALTLRDSSLRVIQEAP